jgi:hypothetical protein
MAKLLHNDLPEAAAVLADRAYDADWMHVVIEDQDYKVCIRPRPTAPRHPLLEAHLKSKTSSSASSTSPSSSGTYAPGSAALPSATWLWPSSLHLPVP